MIPIRPVVSLYKQPRSDTYLLEEYVENPRFRGTLTLWQERTPINRRHLEAMGLAIVLDSLKAFSTRSPGPEFSPPRETPSEFRSFARKSLKVSLRLLNETTLELEPDTRVGGGYQGSAPERRLFLPLPSANSDFLEKLDEAFARSG